MSDKPKVKAIEAKHITHVNSKNGKDDLHVVKEVVHFEDGSKLPRIRQLKNYQRPFWVTKKGLQNHNDKKDFEFVRNLDRFTCTQRQLIGQVHQKLYGYRMSGYVPMRVLARSHYLYGVDVGSVSCLKYDYRKRFPDTITPNTVVGGDIETNVYEDDRDGEIICMSVTFKNKAYLAYYKRWVHDIEDPIKATHATIEEIPEVKALFEGRGIELEVEVVETPANVVINCIKRLHEWKPDFFSFWNMDFDISRIIKCLEDHAIDPALVFSDPEIPAEYRYFHYRQDSDRNISTSGVNKTKSPEDQWHWVTAPASFQCIDAMSVYRLTRLAAGKAPSYSLDFTLATELNVDEEFVINTKEDLDKALDDLDKLLKRRPGSYPYYKVSNPDNDAITKRAILTEDGNEIEEQLDVTIPEWVDIEEPIWDSNIKTGYRFRYILDYGKLKFPEVDHLIGIEWHREMQVNHKIKYGVYNLVDSIRLEQLDEQIDDLSSNITLYSKYSDYKNFNSNPKRLCDDMHFWYLEHADPKVMASSADEQAHSLDHHTVGANNWIVTLPSYLMAPSGLKVIKEAPNYSTYMYAHNCDLDVRSTYPTVSQILNIGRETLAMEFSRIAGVTETTRREFGVNLLCGKTNAMELTQKTMQGVSLDEMLESYMKYKETNNVPKS